MLADASKYEQLRLAKEEEKRQFEQALIECRQEHETIMSKEREQHRKEMEFKNTTMDGLLKDIERTRKRNDAILDSIQKDTNYEIQDIREKNTGN